jgi:hypothetical protein
MVAPLCDGDGVEISCDECVMNGSSACADCMVTFLVGREPGDAVVIDVAEERAVRMLARAGLVPELRHHRRVGT